MSTSSPAPSAGKIEVVRYSEALREQWDNFVAHSHQGTLFHTRAFLAYHPPERFQDESLLFFKKGKLLAVLPAAIRAHDETRVLCSHPGASFGGFAVPADLALAETEQVIAAFLHHCQDNVYAGVELTLAPQIYFARPNHHVEYLLYRHGFRYRKRDMTSGVALAGFVESWPREMKRAARRAEKRGVKIEESEDWETFYALLAQHMWQRHRVRPTHSLEELQRLRALCPQRVRLFAAFVEEEMIAGTVLFLCNRSAALAFYYVSRREGFQNHHGFAALCAEVLQWCARQNFHYLDFGTYTIDSQPNWGLADFKESLGGRGFFRDTMHIDLRAASAASACDESEKMELL